MICNAVFDPGNVLLKFKPLEYLKKRYDERTVQILYEGIFLSKEWLDLDRGIIERNDAVSVISGRYPLYSDSIEVLFRDWAQMLDHINGSVEILQGLKANGYAAYLLSNFHREAFDEVYGKYDFFNNFDGMVISSDVHLLKPEREIYVHLCKKYGIKPEESVFIDDTVKNVEVAIEAGFNAVCFES